MTDARKPQARHNPNDDRSELIEAIVVLGLVVAIMLGLVGVAYYWKFLG